MLTIVAALAISQSVTPAIALFGQRSEMAEHSISLISNEHKWAATWYAHTGVRVGAPRIDFKNYVVLAAFNGRSAQTSGFELISTSLSIDTLNIRLRPMWYSVGGGRLGSVEELAKRHASTAYGFFVFPRTFTKVVVEEQLLGPKNEPPKFAKPVALTVEDV
jgi:hypothetical protein